MTASAGLRAPPPRPPPTLLPRFVSQLGHVLIASGEAVAVIEDRCGASRARMACRTSASSRLPTVLFVKLDDGHGPRLDFTSEEGMTLRFDQIESAFALASDAQKRCGDAGAGTRAAAGDPRAARRASG